MNRLTINILGKDEPSDDKKTAVLPSRKLRKLGRRRTGGIRFWDLGYLANGTNLPFDDPHSADPQTTLSEAQDLATLTLAYYNQIQALITATPIEDWKTTFKQLDDTYDGYGSALGGPIIIRYKGTGYNLQTSTAWDGTTLRPNGATTDESFEVQINTRLVHRVRLGLSGPNKVTTILDYSAASVAFTPSKSMDVFLVPALMDVTTTAYHEWTLHPFLPNIVTYAETDRLNTLRFLYPRELFQDENVSIYGEYLDFIQWSDAAIFGPDTLAAYERVHRITTYWKNLHSYRAVKIKTPLGGPVTVENLDPATYAPLSLYPAPPTMPSPDPAPSVPAPVQLWAQFFATDVLAGALVAVIKKGGTYYYVWQD